MGPSKHKNQRQKNPPNINNQPGGATNNNNINGPDQDTCTNLTDAIRQSSEILYQQNPDLTRLSPFETQNTQNSQNSQAMANRVGQDQGQGQGQDRCQIYYTNYNSAQASTTPTPGHIPYNPQSAFYHGPPPLNIAQSSQDNGVPAWAASLCQQMLNIQTTLNGHTEKWHSVENKIENQSQDLLKMQNQLSEITKIKQNLEFTNNKVKIIQNDVQSLQEEVKSCDQVMQQYSDMYDDLVTNNCDVDKRLHAIESKIAAVEHKQAEFEQHLDQTNDRVTDVQWRGMRENLLFCGIREAENFRSEGEDCEQIVKTFIREDLEIEDDIQFDRCHRIGRFNKDNPRPRPIVAKFTYFKDKERVKYTGQQKLKDSAFWVKDQYPKEMEDKRKSLYAVADEARKNESNRVALVRDRLYINGKLYRPNGGQQQQQHQQQHQRRQYDRNHFNRASVQNYGNRRNTAQWGRTFYRSNIPTQHVNHSLDPPVLTERNRFAPLTTETPTTTSGNNQSRKKKATSPLEGGNTSKKQHCDSSDDESDTCSDQSTLLIEADVHACISDSQASTQQPFTITSQSVIADDTFSVSAGRSCDQAGDAIETLVSREQPDSPRQSRDNASQA